MKNQTLIVLALFFCHFSYAQIEEGRMFIGGNITFNSFDNTAELTLNNIKSKYELGDFNRIGAKLDGLYFAKKNLALGLSLHYNLIQNINKDPANSTELEYLLTDRGISVVGRYYKALNDKVLFYGQARIGFGMLIETQTLIEPGNKDVTDNLYDAFYSEIRPGFNYFIGPNWALDFNMGFIRYNVITNDVYENGIPHKNTDIDSGIGFDMANLSLGVIYFLR